MDDAFESALLLSPHGNDEATVADGDDLILKLISIRRTLHHRLKAIRQARTGHIQRPADSGEFRTVPFVDFSVVNGAAQLFTKFAKVRQAVGGSGKTRKLLAIVLPADAQSLNLTQEALNGFDLR